MIAQEVEVQAAVIARPDRRAERVVLGAERRDGVIGQVTCDAVARSLVGRLNLAADRVGHHRVVAHRRERRGRVRAGRVAVRERRPLGAIVVPVLPQEPHLRVRADLRDLVVRVDAELEEHGRLVDEVRFLLAEHDALTGDVREVVAGVVLALEVTPHAGVRPRGVTRDTVHLVGMRESGVRAGRLLRPDAGRRAAVVAAHREGGLLAVDRVPARGMQPAGVDHVVPRLR